MYKVLLVDDEPFILEGLTEIIKWEEYGLEIEGKALDGLAAIEILETKTIHVLITDIKMPKMDGLKLIKYIKDHDMNIKCIILSGFNDFEYVRDAAKLGIENYLLKPVDENELIPTLLNAIEKIESEMSRKIEVNEGISILRDNILFRWVSGDIGEEELCERASLLNINLDCNNYLVAVVKIIETPCVKSDIHKNHKRLNSFAVNNVCKLIIEEKELGTAFYDLNGDIILLFSSYSLSQDDKAIRQVLSQCINDINTLLKLNVFVAAGSFEKEYQRIYKSYANSKKIQDYGLVSGANTIVFFEEIDLSSTRRRTAFKYDLKSLNTAIKTMDKNAACNAIDELFHGLHGFSDLTPNCIQEITADALINIMNTIKTINFNTTNLLDHLKVLLSDLYFFEKIDELKKWLKTIINECFNTVDKEGENISPIVKKTMEYIKFNYSEDINLKTVAAGFNMNAFYLGQLFSKEVGTNFNNYLNTIRIEKAKDLLLSKKLKAQDIATMVGYVNINYFSTVFKKITGISPSEYRDGV